MHLSRGGNQTTMYTHSLRPDKNALEGSTRVRACSVDGNSGGQLAARTKAVRGWSSPMARVATGRCMWGSVADPGHLLSPSIRNESATEVFKSPLGTEMSCDSNLAPLFCLPDLFGVKGRDAMDGMTRLLDNTVAAFVRQRHIQATKSSD